MTATVIGLFCPLAVLHAGQSLPLTPAGDALVMYTDGVTEANDAEGEEFGEKRLVETVRQNSGKAYPSELIRWRFRMRCKNSALANSLMI